MVDDAPQPSEEEKARLAKLLAETELAAAEKDLLAAQLKKATRENDTAEIAANSLSGRNRFVPTAAHFFQWMGAVLVLASAFFFLYQPVIEAVREVTEKEGKLATLGVEIAEIENSQSQTSDTQRREHSCDGVEVETPPLVSHPKRETSLTQKEHEAPHDRHRRQLEERERFRDGERPPSHDDRVP